MAFPQKSMPANATFAIHLRCFSSSGGKDWIGVLIAGATQIYAIWGTSSNVLKYGGQGKYIRESATRSDLDEYVRKKLAKGYKVVDEYSNGRWDSENIPAAAPAPQPKPQPKPTTPNPPSQPAQKPSTPLASILSDTEGESGPMPEAWFW